MFIKNIHEKNLSTTSPQVYIPQGSSRKHRKNNLSLDGGQNAHQSWFLEASLICKRTASLKIWPLQRACELDIRLWHMNLYLILQYLSLADKLQLVYIYKNLELKHMYLQFIFCLSGNLDCDHCGFSESFTPRS